jgi:peroxin-14
VRIHLPKRLPSANVECIVLQDPSVAGSPIENRIAFLQSKNLTQQEVDTALARANGESAPAPNQTYAAQQQPIQQPQPGYGGYQQYLWQQPPPPEVPKRDWRDWFIMATVMGGVGYGLYFVTKVCNSKEYFPRQILKLYSDMYTR